MDKRQFLEELRARLSDLTSEERTEALEYYEEYFADAGEENEADVILSLGTPEQVASQIKAGLHKEEEGMFTENGYREKIESDNPLEVYGKKDKRQDRAQRDNAGPLPWGYAGRKRDSSAKKVKREGMSGGMIALLVVLGILASPLILGLGAGLLGVILGIIGTIIGVIAALFAVVVAFLAAGVGMFFGGFGLLFVHPLGGIVCIAGGCLLIALFLLCVVLLVLLCSKFFPWLIREVEHFGKYISRKWSERRGRGETV